MTEEIEKVEEITEVDITEESSVELEVESVEEVENPLDVLQREREQLADQVLRLQAEIANMRRINMRERQDAAKYRSQSLATSLLDVVDNLERALATEATSEDALALKKGVEMVHAQFVTAFEKENIETLNPLGEAFDPNFHQAVSVMPKEGEQASDTVVDVLQKGYKLNDRVLRPAMVLVSE